MTRQGMTRQQEMAMFADMARRLQQRGYARLTKKHYSSLKSLQKQQGIEGPVTVASMDELVRKLRKRFKGHVSMNTVNNRVWGSGWEGAGRGASRVVIADPRSGLALKVTKTDAARLTGWFGGKRQIVTEAKKSKSMAGVRTSVMRSGRTGKGIRYSVSIPRLYAVSPSGKYSVVEYAGEKVRLPAITKYELGKKAKKKYGIHDVGGRNIRLTGRKWKTIKIVDLGVPVGGLEDRTRRHRST